MSKKSPKTNAARLLEQAKIAFELISYEVDESDLSAVHVAEQIGVPVQRVFKTLVLKGNVGGYFVCIIPGNDELDLKKSAKLTGCKSCEMIPMKDLLAVTGYIRGACSPIGMKKRFRTFLHESCLEFDRIHVSAGLRGLQIRISPQDLISATGAEVASLIVE